MNAELLEQLQASAEEYRQKCSDQKKLIEHLCAEALVRTDLSETDYLTAEVFRMCLADTREWDDPMRSPYLSNPGKTRRLGSALHHQGGFRLMQQVCEMVPLYDQRELEHAWDGVGDWRA